jgi:hypothetical protein
MGHFFWDLKENSTIPYLKTFNKKAFYVPQLSTKTQQKQAIITCPPVEKMKWSRITVSRYCAFKRTVAPPVRDPPPEGQHHLASDLLAEGAACRVGFHLGKLVETPGGRNNKLLRGKVAKLLPTGRRKLINYVQ